MHPERAARILSILGVYLLVIAVGLRLISLMITTGQVRMGIKNTVVQPARPFIDQYTIASNGNQVSFVQQAGKDGDQRWFSMPNGGGRIVQAQPPKMDISPFQIKDGQVYYSENNTQTEIDRLPGNPQVNVYALSPDSKSLAFAAKWANKNTGLYIVSEKGKLDWVGDHGQIDEITWSPDGQHLALVARDNGGDQIFITRRDGQEEQQLTDDQSVKMNINWLPDGREIAYIAVTSPSTPTPINQRLHEPIEQMPLNWSIRLIDTNGNHQRKLFEDDQQLIGLTWGMEDSSVVLFFSKFTQGQEKNKRLFSINPIDGRIRQVYPPLEITAFICPPQIQSGQQGLTQITITNQGINPADVSLILRARSDSFPGLSSFDENLVRLEDIQIPAGATQTIEWPFRSQPVFFTHLSAGINPMGLYAMDEKRCVVKNKFLGLPNLAFLAPELPLIIIGLAFCTPWLRIQKRASLWLLYFTGPLLVLVILILELKMTKF
jgi:hypothetical protein